MFPISYQSIWSIGSDASMVRPIASWFAVTGEGEVLLVWTCLCKRFLTTSILARTSLSCPLGPAVNEDSKTYSMCAGQTHRDLTDQVAQLAISVRLPVWKEVAVGNKVGCRRRPRTDHAREGRSSTVTEFG